jgi:UDP-2-acetamido-3-amino-2,3-dideoxy-glucuronate N-acetyltransferase
MIHSSSDVMSSNIGQGTKIWQFCVVLEKAVIGKNCNINCQVFIENDVIIGNNVTVKCGVQLWDGLRIGDNVFIGSNATFTNDPLPRSKVYPDFFKITTIHDGASIGANATILAGINIGSYAMIGAGAVVIKDVPPFTVWFGNPASLKGYISKENTLIDLKLKDKSGNNYEIINGEPKLKSIQ